jgi:hypothetical protein
MSKTTTKKGTAAPPLAIFEANYQNSRMATKTCFGSFLPKHVLVAKSFGHSTIFTDSSVAAAKTCFGCQSFFWQPKVVLAVGCQLENSFGH